jgi:hypothetical protein
MGDPVKIDSSKTLMIMSINDAIGSRSRCVGPLAGA